MMNTTVSNQNSGVFIFDNPFQNGKVKYLFRLLTEYYNLLLHYRSDCDADDARYLESCVMLPCIQVCLVCMKLSPDEFLAEAEASGLDRCLARLLDYREKEGNAA